MKGLTKEMMRKPAKHPNMEPQVRWEIIDRWLERIHHPAGLKVVAEVTGVSTSAIYQRRKHLGLPPLRRGRPKETELTVHEEIVSQLLKRGDMKQKDVAKHMGISPQAVHSVVDRIQAKEREGKVAVKRGCRDCHGSGVELCTHCKGIGPHTHICSTCHGDSVYGGPIELTHE